MTFIKLSTYTPRIEGRDEKFAWLRWKQTAGYGYAPNDRQKNVFMAVAMDLGNPQSPYASAHPTDKKDVGERLATASLAVAYGKHVYYSSPLVSKIDLQKKGNVEQLKILYRSANERIETSVIESIPWWASRLVFVVKLTVPCCRKLMLRDNIS